jgi:hypothetical protein
VVTVASARAKPTTADSSQIMKRETVDARAQILDHEVRKSSYVQGRPYEFVRISGLRRSVPSRSTFSGIAAGIVTRRPVLDWRNRIDALREHETNHLTATIAGSQTSPSV